MESTMQQSHHCRSACAMTAPYALVQCNHCIFAFKLNQARTSKPHQDTLLSIRSARCNLQQHCYNNTHVP
eukprot:4424061-Amphidinium_carterae.1